MKVTVDTDLCIGCQACVDTCPDIFEMDGDKAVVKNDAIPDSAKATCQEAAETCPTDAIKCE